MKILHVIPTFDLAAGGPPRIAWGIAAATAALGHDVTLLSYAVGNLARPTAKGSDRVTVHTLTEPTGRLDRLTGRSARRAFGKLIPAFDVVHTHDVWTPVSRAAMSAAATVGVPFVLLPNGMLDPWSLRQKRLKKQVVLALGHRRLINRAALVHVGNIDEQQGVRLAGITAPTVVVPNGVDPDEFATLPPVGSFHARRPELNGNPYLIFLGRLHYKKGLDLLAAAFAGIVARHPGLQLVVAGPNGGAEVPFREQIVRLGISSNVHIVGPLYTADRIAAMSGAIAFVLPSRQEGFSMAILEAMASGTPVVISDACHFPEVATAGAGEVVPLNAGQIAEALNRVLTSPHRAEIGRTGRELVLSQYSWPRVAEKLTAAYRKIVTG